MPHSLSYNRSAARRVCFRSPTQPLTCSRLGDSKSRRFCKRRTGFTSLKVGSPICSATSTVAERDGAESEFSGFGSIISCSLACLEEQMPREAAQRPNKGQSKGRLCFATSNTINLSRRILHDLNQRLRQNYNFIADPACGLERGG